jgi:hypothetical protein
MKRTKPMKPSKGPWAFGRESFFTPLGKPLPIPPVFIFPDTDVFK